MVFRKSEEITKKEKPFVSQEGMVVALNNKFSKHCVMCFSFKTGSHVASTASLDLPV